MYPLIQLKSGNFFDYTDPENSIYTIEDIAWGLAHICRFSGQCNRFYSVAEHCYHITKGMNQNGEPYIIKALGLFHDSSEAFCMDVPKPLKILLPEYKAIEERVEAAIMKKFNLPYPYPSIIKEYDNTMLLKEQQVLFDHRHKWATESNIDFDVDFKFWIPERAYEEFMSLAEYFK